MSRWVGAAVLVVGFVALARRFGLVERSRDVLAVSRRSLNVIRSADLTDEMKESALQRDARQLFRLFFLLALGGAASLLLPLGLVWLGERAGWVSLADTLAAVLSLPFLMATVILGLILVAAGRLRGNDTAGYSRTDRILHRLAFRTRLAQVALADVEDRLFARDLAACKAERPVFITALPRAGTTLLLECFAGSDEFASHCYRDMPFVLIPCLWQRFSGAFRQSGAARERAHGDGMQIDFDSPEAFEEIVWRAFWSRHYRRDRILPWEDEEDEEFSEFLQQHMRKIISLRRGKDTAGVRYVSKNNLNIARTGVLRQFFPDATVLVPFRAPAQHALSLLRQHLNFLRIHREDRFSSEYMRAIGHYDFGQNLRPVDFRGWLDKAQSRDAETLAFWFEYWVAAYEYLLDEAGGRLHFLCYERLCEDPRRALPAIAAAVGSRDTESLLAFADRIRAPEPRLLPGGEEVPAELRSSAEKVHSRLLERALF